MNMRHALAFSLLTTLLSPFLSSVSANQEFKNVAPAELKANPQNYWARGVIFNDVMVAGPGGAPLRVENRQCTPITLQVAGICYVDPALLPVIKELPLQQTYVFRGTVLQAKAPGSWFFGSKVYLILITGVEATIDTDKMSQNFQKMYDRIDQVPPKGSTQAMTALLLEVQTALAKHAREKEIPLEQLLSDNSESSKKALGIIYEAIHTQAARSKTTAEEILASYILAFLRAQYQPQPATPVTVPPLTNTPPPTPTKAPEPAPEASTVTNAPVAPAPAVSAEPTPGPAPVISPAPVAVPTNTANESPQEPPKSWLQKRRERQAQQAAETAEQERIAQEKRLQEAEAERIRQEQERQALEELKKQQQTEREEKARLAAEAKEAKRKAAEAKREEERKAREEALQKKKAEKAERARLAAEAEEAEQARLLAEKEAFEKKASTQSPEETPQTPLPTDPAASDDLNAPVGL